MSDNHLNIKGAIVHVRGQRVILAHDLAKFYESGVREINQYRKRKKGKFTDDYAFQLTIEELENLKSQNVISSSAHGGSHHLPWAYTEHGLTMISMGMKSGSDKPIVITVQLFKKYHVLGKNM